MSRRASDRAVRAFVRTALTRRRPYYSQLEIRLKSLSTLPRITSASAVQVSGFGYLLRWAKSIEHGLLQVLHRSVTAAFHAAFGDFGKHALDEVQPATDGGCGVDVVTRTARQPALDLHHLLGAIVVHHQVHFLIGRFRRHFRY
jgi:hypothetical protein